MNRRGAEHAEKGMAENTVPEAIIGAAIEVHKHPGPGLLESAYEACLCRELELRGILFERQKPLPLNYKGQSVECRYRLDLVVGGLVIVEIKAVESFLPIHEAQLLTYPRLTGLRVGLLLNFNVPVLTQGIRRIVLGLPESFSALSAPLR